MRSNWSANKSLNLDIGYIGDQCYNIINNEYNENANMNQYTIDAIFQVDIRICQPENSDVHRGEAEVNIAFEG